ncbi:MAG: alpha/beta hydrolase [Bacteriovoracaceae bacterium]|nr:alpha/beta hydrolase [Bacteriovoracaceae bacterium]
MNRKEIVISGQNISYCEAGDPASQSIVFIHGNSSSSQSFREVMDSAILQKYHLLAIDLMGHGKSEKACDPNNYHLPYYATLITEFVQKNDLKNVILAGHSLGGHIAIEAAPNCQNLKGVMVWGTPPLGNPPEMARAFLPTPEVAGFFSAEVDKEMAQKLSQVCFYESEKNTEAIDEFANSILSTDPNAREFMAKSVGELNFLNELEIIEKLKVPLCVCIGTKEKVIDPNYFNELEVYWFWREKVMRSECGHTFHIEQTSAFTRLLSEFSEDAFSRQVVAVPAGKSKSKNLLENA